MTKPDVSVGRVLAAVEAVFGPIGGLKPINGGLESRAYRSVGPPHIIVRINPDRAGFEKDAFAFSRFANADLPIPKVHHIGDLGDYSFCISEEAPGVTLEDVDVSALPVLLEPTARVMRAIASADIAGISGYGLFNFQGQGMHDSWRAFLLSVEDNWTLPVQDVSRIFERFHSLVERIPERRALIHGDFGSNNVLTDGRGITAVIDWSEAMVGDPLYDVANVFFWRTGLPCMEAQARYFEKTLGHYSEIRERLLCYQLHIGLAQVHSGHLLGRTELAQWALSRSFELLA